jgi:hypothetical protein
VLAFTCDNCGQLLFFENTVCLHCGATLGVVPSVGLMALQAVDDDSGDFRLWGDDSGARWRACANRDRLVCNWLVPAGDHPFCASCALTADQPPLGDPAGGAELIVAETAKRRLIFELIGLGLPVVGRDRDPNEGLAFEFASSASMGEPVTTGHQDGIIAMDLAESDDVHREGVRHAMGEPYRTVLGHLRHEIGHYYWMVFARDPARLARIRARFGDDTVDYADALESHYGSGPPAGWDQIYVSAYATTHPWEDWAETFAHYLHIRATLQTAATYGLVVAGPAVAEGTPVADTLVSTPDDDVDDEPFRAILADWLPLTYALNELNRAMGRDALYPFVLAPAVVDKLALVHRMVTQVAREQETTV